MFYWMKRSSGGSETLDGLGNMSKSDILRGIVTEKLSTAAEEILAVVERTVAGYEEEAAGFRREIDRQRKQLELLLQPRVTLEKKALGEDVEEAEVVVLSEGEEDQQVSDHPGVEDTGSLGLWFDDDDEEQLLAVHSVTPSSRQRREDLKDPDFQISPRFSSVKRRPGRPRNSDTRNHLDLKIRILGDSQVDVLSKNVFKKSPVLDLQCPRGLQEADFLNLLRSSFPQLADQELFDFFTSDRSRRLQPLNVTPVTPEEIFRSISLGGVRRSVLYIRLKTGGDPEDVTLLQGSDDFPSTSADQTFSRCLSERRKRGRPRLGEGPTHHLLRVCMLEDSLSDVLSKKVYSPDLLKSPVQDLRCPRGLQELDFLDLLRSVFPQLSGETKSFHVFKSDRNRRLQRLRVKTLTPEEIYRSMRSTGVEKAPLYILPKTGEEEEKEEQEEAELQLLQRNREDDQTSSFSLQQRDHRVSVLSRSSASQQDGEEDEGPAGVHMDLSDDDEEKERDKDWRPKRGKLMVGSKNPCKVCGVWYRIQGSLIKHAWTHLLEPQSVCGVCGQQFGSTEELKDHLRRYQKTHDCSYCGKSFLTVTGLNSHVTLHTGNRPFKCDICNKTFAHTSSLSVHRWVHAADKPHKCNICPKAFGLKAQLRAHMKTHAGRDGYHCSVCGKSLSDLRSLARHKTTHSGERRYGCEVCGKRFKLSYTLKAHEKIHTSRERTFLCHICCKSFFSNCGLTAHMRTHSTERPFPCGVCGKGFVSNGERKVHMRIHTGEAPYGCSQCGRFFKRKTHLNTHVRSHLGIKLYVCSVCGKACSRQEHLNVHMRTHNGERPYQCSVCDKAFTQGHCLKTHMKSHHHGDSPFLNAPTP